MNTTDVDSRSCGATLLCVAAVATFVVGLLGPADARADTTIYLKEFQYQANDPSDRNRTKEDLVADGVDTCNRVRAGRTLPELVANLTHERGFTVDGAGAVIAAAVRFICPETRFSIMTDTDREAEIVGSNVRRELGFSATQFPDPLIEANVKNACAALDRGATPLDAKRYMMSVGMWPQEAGRGDYPPVEEVGKVLLDNATRHCPRYREAVREHIGARPLATSGIPLTDTPPDAGSTSNAGSGHEPKYQSLIKALGLDAAEPHESPPAVASNPTRHYGAKDEYGEDEAAPGSDRGDVHAPAAARRGDVVQPESARSAASIQGTVTDARGRPMQGTKIFVSGTSSAGEKVTYSAASREDGSYSLRVAEGRYTIKAFVDTTYAGRMWRLPLHPTDDSNNEFDPSNGVRKDFRWRLSGAIPGPSPGEGPEFYYGGGIAVHFSCVFCAEEPSSTPNTKVTFVLTPIGPLIDGSTGHQITRVRTMAALERESGLIGDTNTLEDIPLGLYRVTAIASLPQGDIPLSLSTPRRSLNFAKTLDIKFSPADEHDVFVPNGIKMLDVDVFRQEQRF